MLRLPAVAFTINWLTLLVLLMEKSEPPIRAHRKAKDAHGV